MSAYLVEQILQYSDTCWGWTEGTVGSWRTYDRDELKVLCESALASVPTGGNLVEIGTFGGLSTSVLLSVARERKAKLWACDPFRWVGHLAKPQLYQILRQFADVMIDFREMTSEEYHKYLVETDTLPLMVDFIHIDGDHGGDAVDLDCRLWLPLLRQGGIACFHDYNRLCDDAVKGLIPAVDRHTQGWGELALLGRNWILARRKQ